MPDMNENAETQQEYLGRCHDCTAPQTEVNMLSRHILELQADKGRLTDSVRELEAQIEKMKCCSNCNHFNKESDIEYCQNCERQLVNSLEEEIIKDEWKLRR